MTNERVLRAVCGGMIVAICANECKTKEMVLLAVLIAWIALGAVV
jgi:hypothetical protein